MNDETRLLGIDHGLKRIGVALSDPLGIIATPLTVLQATPKAEVLTRLAALVEEHAISKIVVGLPTDSEGHIGPQARTVLRWARQLAGTVSVPIVLWDESYSTADATATRRGKKHGRELDAVAAAVILQSYLEARRSTHEPGQPIQTFDDAP
jgi:putative Holliday junction resolvase